MLKFQNPVLQKIMLIGSGLTQTYINLPLFADIDFLLDMISAAQLFPISVWNFPEEQVKEKVVDKGSNKI